MMDLDRRLYYLSLNSALKFVAMSSASFSSQMMEGTTSSTPVSGLVLATEEDEADEEDEDAGVKVLAL